MLIEDGVIVKGEERWRVEPTRLTTVRVPPTLTGVLQARLDRLPLEERTILQRASVVGRLFWDRAVVRISQSVGGGMEETEIVDSLSALRGKEMIFGVHLQTGHPARGDLRGRAEAAAEGLPRPGG
jgi:predicted ATPase